MDQRARSALAKEAIRAELRGKGPYREWYWDAAEREAKSILAGRKRVSEGMQESIAYAAEESLRAALGNAPQLARLEAELATLAATKNGKRATRSAIIRLLRKHIVSWRERRLQAGRAQAVKAIEAQLRERQRDRAKIAAMDARKLHAFTHRYNWDDGIWAMDAVARHLKCALGTALLVYWLAKPYWYLQWRTATASDDPVTFEMLRFIEQRVQRGGYAHAGIAFDPRDEDFTSDTYEGERKVRTLPSHMLIATTKRDVVPIRAS